MEQYVPIDGFFDLNNFELSKSEFLKCLRLQKLLKSVQDASDYYKTYCKKDWEKAKQISAELQMFLLPRLKKGCELA